MLRSPILVEKSVIDAFVIDAFSIVIMVPPNLNLVLG